MRKHQSTSPIPPTRSNEGPNRDGQGAPQYPLIVSSASGNTADAARQDTRHRYQSSGATGPSNQPFATYGNPQYGAAGYNQTYGAVEYDQTYDQAGYDQAGYNQAGYPQAGYNQAGYPQAYGAASFNQAGSTQAQGTASSKQAGSTQAHGTASSKLPYIDPGVDALTALEILERHRSGSKPYQVLSGKPRYKQGQELSMADVEKMLQATDGMRLQMEKEVRLGGRIWKEKGFEAQYSLVVRRVSSLDQMQMRLQDMKTWLDGSVKLPEEFLNSPDYGHRQAELEDCSEMLVAEKTRVIQWYRSLTPKQREIVRMLGDKSGHWARIIGVDILQRQRNKSAYDRDD